MKGIRNVAIVAHVDHGKTTLIDSLLKGTGLFRDNEHVPDRLMDSYDLEKERGITIFSKHTGIYYKDYKINLIDTPGHSDFSGEIERILGMVDGVLVLVDAQEGPMPQTSFVINKALQKKIKPIVVLNKIDRPHADPDNALTLTFELFEKLGATNEQLDFPYCYASGLSGFAKKNLGDPSVNMNPLLDTIINCVPQPQGNPNAPFLMQATTLHHNNFLGYQATGQVINGQVSKGDLVVCIDTNDKKTEYNVNTIECYEGIKKIPVSTATTGDIINISGILSVKIGDVICSPESTIRLDPPEVSEPVLSMEVSVNNSPLAGKEGKNITINKIYERLTKEARTNISLKVEKIDNREDAILIYGRGELHLAIVLISLLRENFECTISKPKVIFKKDGNKQLEPYQNLHVEVPEIYSGPVIEELSKRKGIIRSLKTDKSQITKIDFHITTRGLIGYRSKFLVQTKDEGIFTSSFESFGPVQGEIQGRQNGSIVSMTEGKATGYALFNLKTRGIFFISPGAQVYKGMVLGEHNRSNDIFVNITRTKQLTNMRAAGSDENILLQNPKKLTLESAMDFLSNDEMLEITPKSIRIRKISNKL